MKTKLNKRVFMNAALIAAGLALVFGILGFIPFLNILSASIACFVGIGLPIGLAYYAVKQHNVTKDNLVDGLIIGALGAVAGAIGGGIVSFILGVIGAVLGLGSAALSSTLSGSNLTATEAAAVGSIGVGAAIIGGIIGFITSIFISAVVGAIVGAVVAALTETKGGMAKPAMEAKPAEKKDADVKA